MIENILTTDEKAIEHTWYTSAEKAVHDGAKLEIIRQKLNEIIDVLNAQPPSAPSK